MPLARSGWLSARFGGSLQDPQLTVEGLLRKKRPFGLFESALVALIHSIGHSNRSFAEFLALLQANGITALADIRQFTRSRANPQFNGDVLASTLAEASITYDHIAALGGRRSSKLKDSPNGLWENAAFRSYADYALTDPFESGYARLLELAEERRVAMMCAEAVWWRCHRRIVADYALARGAAVRHIFTPSKAERATRTLFARLDRKTRTLRYPAAEPVTERTPRSRSARSPRTPARGTPRRRRAAA